MSDYTPRKDLSKLFGCCRVVHNDALACCNDFYKQNKKSLVVPKPKIGLLLKQKTPERAWLSEVAAFCSIYKRPRTSISKLL